MPEQENTKPTISEAARSEYWNQLIDLVADYFEEKDQVEAKKIQEKVMSITYDSYTELLARNEELEKRVKDLEEWKENATGLTPP